MLTYTAFFDESYAGTEDGPFVVAGYLFKPLRLGRFEAQWHALLRRFGLPYFHMASFSHQKPPFDKLTDDQQDRLNREVVRLITAHAECGLIVTVDQKTFREVAAAGRLVADRYDFCTWVAMMATTIWVGDNNPGVKVNYVFEAGETHQGTANQMMNVVLKDDKAREVLHYRSHRFVEGISSIGCQAADILAWLWLKEIRRIENGSRQSQRKDLTALTELDTRVISADQLFLVDMVKGIHAQVAGQKAPSSAGEPA